MFLPKTKLKYNSFFKGVIVRCASDEKRVDFYASKYSMSHYDASSFILVLFLIRRLMLLSHHFALLFVALVDTVSCDLTNT